MTVMRLDLWPKQLQALETEATEILFGGATRGGKSHLARVLLTVACVKIPNLQCTLIRQKFQDILDNHVYGPNGFNDLLAPLIAKGYAKVTQSEVTFSNGSRIAFKHCQDERQLNSAQGITSHILVVDEATQISERLIRMFRGWCTMTEEMKASLPEYFQGKLPKILYTANPIGPSVGFFRKYFVKARPPEAIEQVGAFKRQFIPSKVTDNPSEDADAVKGRMLELGDRALATALLEGDWDQLVGEFLPEFDPERHVVPDFTPPDWWFRFRGMDLGYAEPFAVYWVAVSDGEVFRDSQGRERWFPRGAFIFYNEWYGCDSVDTSKGLRMRNEDIAAGIVSRSEIRHHRVVTLTDSLPFQDRGGEMVPTVFAKNGCPITLGDTSRVVGWNQLRSRLIGIPATGKDGQEIRIPMIYFSDRCTFAQDYFPMLTRHPSESKKEDAQEHGEPTHCLDAIRICCMAHTIIKDKIEPMESRINRALQISKPTIKRITAEQGQRFF